MIDVHRPANPGRVPARLLPLAAGLLLVLAAAPAARGGGFALFDQGAKGMGLAGAFTAQADDGSAVFYNAGGLALLESGALTAGAVAEALGDVQVQGLAPGLAAGAGGEETADPELAGLHAYWVHPLRPRLTLGLGVHTPFHFTTEWEDPDAFPGRTLSLASELRTLDVNPALAVRFGRGLGLGAGVVLRATELSMERRIQRPDPLGTGPLDVATLDLESDTETGFGWNAGVLQQVSPYFAWGVSYRSGIDVDYAGAGVLTQIPTGNDQFDDLIAATLPFDRQLALTSAVDFPALAAAGVAFGFGTYNILEIDAGWSDWSRVDAIPFLLPNDPSLSSTVELRFDDAMSVRVGFLHQTAGGAQWRAGYAFEESPQPDETVGPFFADADAHVVSLGFGKDWLDVAVAWVQYADRSVVASVDGFNGNWSANALRLGVTVRNVFGAAPPKLPQAPPPPALPGGR
jgi:long-chain fatty acid transport protein